MYGGVHRVTLLFLYKNLKTLITPPISKRKLFVVIVVVAVAIVGEHWKTRKRAGGNASRVVDGEGTPVVGSNTVDREREV